MNPLKCKALLVQSLMYTLGVRIVRFAFVKSEKSHSFRFLDICPNTLTRMDICPNPNFPNTHLPEYQFPECYFLSRMNKYPKKNFQKKISPKIP